MRDGFVALLDVLGFSALVRESGEAGIQRYLNSLTNTTAQSEVKYVVFSDSIVLSEKGDSPESFLAIAGACSRLLGELLSQGIALRGAIAFGNFIREALGESVFVAGRAVIDAYQFEQAQDWVGIMISPSALGRFKDLEALCLINWQKHASVEGFKDLTRRLQWAAFIQPCRSIPFHPSTPFDTPMFDGFAIVPTSGVADPVALCESVTKATENLRWLRAIAPSPSAQRKYQSTLQWLSGIQETWCQIARIQREAQAK
jgi:hypothetical protein